MVTRSQSGEQLGIDCDETFSLVVKPATTRTDLSLTVSYKWPIHQLDVKNAFLNGDLSKTVYMHQPLGFMDSRYPHHVCLLQRSLYGLKQAPRAWGLRLPICLFIWMTLFLQLLLLLYFSRLFPLYTYAIQLLEHANMANYNPSRTPVDTESKLGPEGVPVPDPTLYRSLAGGLQYLTFTRPDLSYAVQHICLYMHDPREPHLAALKRILRYVRGTLDFGLHLYSSSTTSLVGYTDVDWAGCPSTRRSTSSYCAFLGDNLLSWSSKRQQTLSRSSAEAEYRGVANVMAETAWLYGLLHKLNSPMSTATLVYCDNVSAIYLSANPVQHQRTKHIKIDINFVRDMVTTGQVHVILPLSIYYIFIKGKIGKIEDFTSVGPPKKPDDMSKTDPCAIFCSPPSPPPCYNGFYPTGIVVGHLQDHNHVMVEIAYFFAKIEAIYRLKWFTYVHDVILEVNDYLIWRAYEFGVKYSICSRVVIMEMKDVLHALLCQFLVFKS
ncbi:ribonuclease H-like domain-containing protein [Tanacetum coccineum]